MMLAAALDDAMSGCKARATDFSIAAIMSRGSAAAASALRHNSPPLQLGERVKVAGTGGKSGWYRGLRWLVQGVEVAGTGG